MKITPFLAVPLMAVMLSTTAMASEMNKDYAYRPGKVMEHSAPKASDSEGVQKVKRGLNNANEAMRDTADDIHAFFVGDKSDSNRAETVVIARNITADGMIGETILNPQGKSIAKVHDIVLDKDGNAAKVIVSDGGMLGIGNKLAAFDFNRVISQRKDGKVVMSLSQAQIDRAAEYSYDRKDYMAANVMPEGSISVNELLDGDVFDARGNKVADIENLSIVNGSADRLIISFDKTLGMGGKVAALDYDSLSVVKDGSDINVHLNEDQSRNLSGFKKYAAK